MKKLAIAMTALALAACSAPQVKPLDRNPLQSPDGTLELRADVVDGVPMYSLKHGQSDVILPSRLGYDLVGDIDLKDGFKLDDVSYSSFDETWTPVWGEEDHIRNRYNEMLLKLSREDGVRMNIRFRLYNDGLGFRYEFPMENKLTYFKVADELTVTISLEEYRELVDKAVRLDAITDSIRQRVDEGKDYSKINDDLVLILTGTLNYEKKPEANDE
jgi:hypothetical protein